MFACICGFDAESEGDLMSHVLERHIRSYGLETCSHRESCSVLNSADRPSMIEAAGLELVRH